MFAKYRECELLSPGGSVDAIKAAVLAGCDAVYVGGSDFSARASANNLTDEQLFEMIEYLHVRDKRIYLAINTLIKNSELTKVYDYISLMYDKGIDAFIVQDTGILKFLSEYFPDAEIHASTQMAVSGSTAVNFLQKTYGLKRIVLPRELSLDQISKIASNTDIDLECFGHGALCYSYSGQCLMSSVICGRSGNRGRCAQSCRLPYSYDDNKVRYPLSMKELNAVELIPDMIKAGVTSLKLEGRMRAPSYVGAITALYRKYLDLAMKTIKDKKEYKVKQEDLERMEKIFNRSGFTKAYLTETPGSDMISFESSSAQSNEKEALAIFDKLKLSASVQVEAQINLDIGKPAVLSLSCVNKGKKISVYSKASDPTQSARSKALDYETLFRQLAKSDNEYLRLDALSVQQDSPAFMPISALNDLRRKAYIKLEKAIKERNGFKSGTPVSYIKPKEVQIRKTKEYHNRPLSFSAYVQNIEQLISVSKKSYISRIYLEIDELLELKEEELKKKLSYLSSVLRKKQDLYIALPHLYEEGRKAISNELFFLFEHSKISGYLVRNLEELAFLHTFGTQKALSSDYLIYAMNFDSVRMILETGISTLCLPLELNFNELRYFTNRLDSETEMLIYGYPIAMISKSCIKKNHNSCDHTSSFHYLKDRKDYKFAVKSNCSSCYNVIYNSHKIFLADLLYNKLSDLKISRCRLDFTDETEDEILSVLDRIEDYIEKREVKIPELVYSRGHINRGIE